MNMESKNKNDNIFHAYNPATNQIIWSGREANEEEINSAVEKAKKAQKSWKKKHIEERIEHLKAFAQLVSEHANELSESISKDTGKVLWESQSEVATVINKIPISIAAYQERCKEYERKLGSLTIGTHWRPHGVVAVFAPFNFPCHLANAHIIPSLLAGNCILLKPSEQTPFASEHYFKLWQQSELPEGVLNIVQGGATTGKILADHEKINGFFFTGSYRIGHSLNELLINKPGKILALEMGGNNPLIVKNVQDKRSAALIILQSTFLTSGQRCTCARRLILEKGKETDELLSILIPMVKAISVGAYTQQPEAFMGPLISKKAADKLLEEQKNMISNGAISYVEAQLLQKEAGYVSAGLLDVTTMKNRSDEELFGPLLQVIQVENFEKAIEEANNTSYGLVAGLLSDDKQLWEIFFNEVNAGVLNWNTPTSGATSASPFGGIGKSGNFRPSGYLAADYCSYPVANNIGENITASVKQLPAALLGCVVN